ncbi:MAG: shikimate dehydrogenase family protein, partial [Solirubrobacteraceae bacterium]
ALVLGAGGSARAAVWTLRDGGAAEVRVWSRSAGSSRELCRELGGVAVQEIPRDPGEVLINCTPVGLDAADTLDMLPLTAATMRHFTTVADLVYRRGGTQLVNHAAAFGIQTIDGLELLVGQGAIAFGQFTGAAASVAAMRRAVGLSSAP